MVLGIGCDVLYINRIEKLLNYERFLTKYFTSKEVQMFKKYKNTRLKYLSKISSNFCVKEAFSKAISTGVRGFSFKDIEVLRDDLGKPFIKFYGKLEKFNSENYLVHVTISNEKDIVTSFVILENI